MGGCIKPSFVWDIIQEYGLFHLGVSEYEVRSYMTFGPGEARGFYHFLNKFTILDNIPWTEEIIDQSIKSVCDHTLSADYTWLRFSINKYVDQMSWSRKEAVKFVHDAFKRHAPGKVGLMLSLKYESCREGQRKLARMIEDAEVAERLIGIDLVGDEAMFNAEFYGDLFRDWRSANKIVCAHVGESQEVKNVVDAIQVLRVNHIAHGIKVVGHPDCIEMAKDHNICFDLAVSSNYYTGLCDDLSKHPIRVMFDSGLKITIGTDDPVQCNTTMLAEYELLKRHLHFTDAEIDQLKNTAKAESLRFLVA